MRILGVVLAGGQSRRFGSDKAEAVLQGRTLIEHSLDALKLHCDKVIIAGRVSPLADNVADWPSRGMGPLGGLAGALLYAQANGFDQVLSAPVDCVGLPADLRHILEPAPAYLASQPVIGLWPVAAFATLEGILRGDGRHSLFAFSEAVQARAVTPATIPVNVNTPEDLARLSSTQAIGSVPGSTKISTIKSEVAS